MSKPTENMERLLNAYLDGELSGAELDAFHAAVAEDPSLREAIEEHARIEASLRRSFTPPQQAAMRDTLDRAVVDMPIGGEASRRFRRPGPALAVAAAVALAVLGAWIAWIALRPAKNPYGPWRSPEQVYTRTVARGFEPEWVCADDTEFMDTFLQHFGQKLLLDELPQESESLGLSYCNSITNQTVALLGRIRGEPVMVFIDRLDQDRPWPEPYDDALHLHRRELGDLVLYEMTPWEQPGLLGRFVIPGAAP